jgi:periplasmic protein TonB
MVDETQPGRSASWGDRNGIAISVTIHVAALTALAFVLHGSMRFAIYKLPGTADGVQSLTYYSPGSSQSAPHEASTKAVKKPKSTFSTPPVADAVQLDRAIANSPERGVASSGQSGLGDGDITIALEKYFPYPTPSLSSLPQGTAGDVILKAVIDHGKIAELTLLEGLGPAIDDEVIQTVNRWIYIPAMKDGVPVASVEELHFHYERRG